MKKCNCFLKNFFLTFKRIDNFDKEISYCLEFNILAQKKHSSFIKIFF